MNSFELDRRDVVEFKVALTDLVIAVIPLLPALQSLAERALATSVERMAAANNLPIALADALDDLGHACQRAGEHLMRSRTDLGMPLPDGPDD